MGHTLQESFWRKMFCLILMDILFQLSGTTMKSTKGSFLMATYYCIDSVIANRILSKVPKSFWSCTHVNSFQKYALYVNLHILLNI